MILALVTFGVVCHAQMPRPDALAAKSCDAELAVCQALLGTVRSARRREHERQGAAGRRHAVPRVERNELRGEAAGVPSAPY